jgi:steroid Delta-isomerase
MSSSIRPGEVAAQAMRSVELGERDGWLGMFAADALLEDPVGHVPPRRSADERAEFWDTAIAGLEQVRFETRRVHEAPGEAVVLAEITARAPGGATATYDAAIHYVLDDGGAIVSLRAFWDLPDVLAQFAAPA